MLTFCDSSVSVMTIEFTCVVGLDVTVARKMAEGYSPRMSGTEECVRNFRRPSQSRVTGTSKTRMA